MRSETQRIKVLVAILWLSSPGCGIEVGNPHGGKKGGTTAAVGALSLALADAPLNNFQHTYFNLVGMSVVPLAEDGTPGEPLAVAAAVSGKIDVLALNNGKSLALSTAEALPIGDYAGVILDLAEDAPATIVDSGGTEHPLTFAGMERGFFVGQTFSVSEGEELKLTLHVDLSRSISEQDNPDAPERRYLFGPVAHLIRQEDEGTLGGDSALPDASIVCAYLKRRSDFDGGSMDRIPPPPRLGSGDHHGGGGEGDDHHPRPQWPDGPHLPGRFEAKAPNSFPPEAQTIDQDSDATCPHAFAVATITGGKYLFHHLWPGTYFLRFFGMDGAPVPGSEIQAEVAPEHQAGVR